MEENKQIEVPQSSCCSEQNEITEDSQEIQHSDNIVLMEDTLNSSTITETPQNSHSFVAKYWKFMIIGFICSIISVFIFVDLKQIVPKFLPISITKYFNPQAGQIQKGDQPYIEGQPTEEVYDLVKRNTTSALCLDGSPGSYYISREGDPSRVLLFFQPGGWCGDKDYQSTVLNCYARSQGHYGSSKFLESTWRHDGNAFSKHPDNYFRGWKKIHFNYCDGAGHQGSRKQPIKVGDKLIYFRGHNITTENLADLEERIGLFSKAKKVVVAGLSAGGQAVFTWANYVQQRVKYAKVYALSDSGIFYDAENIQTKYNSYRESLKNLMEISNQEIEFPVPECVKDHPGSKQSCMLAQNLNKYLKVPLFTIQSTFDSWSVWNILGVSCSRVSECNNKTVEEKAVMTAYAKNLTNLLQEIGKKPQNGVFGIDCMIHGMMYYYTFLSQDFTIPAGSGRTVSKAIGEWMRNPMGNNVHIDVSQWPGNQGCAKS